MPLKMSKTKEKTACEDVTQLVISVQGGDNEAFSKLFNHYYSEVFTLAISNVHDYDKACDITQETFIEVFKTIQSLRDPEAFHAWLKKITYHRCTSYFRSKEYKHEALVEETEDSEDFFDLMEEDRSGFIPEASLDTKELIEIVRSFIKDLPDEQRDAVIMYYFNEMLLSEIADVQQAPLDTVKSRLYYARRSLKKTIENYEKANGIKLHSISIVSILLQALENTGIVLSTESATLIAEGVTTATGVVTTVVGAAAGTAATGGGIIAAIKAMPIIAKLTAALTTLAVITTPIVLDVNHNNISTSDVGQIITTEAVYTTNITAFCEDNTPYFSGDWTTNNIHILVETDDPQPILFYKLDPTSDFTQFNGDISITEVGSHTIEFKTVYSNSKEDITVFNANIDRTGPIISHTINDMYASSSLANLSVNVIDMDTGERLTDVRSLDQLLSFEKNRKNLQYGTPGLTYRSNAVFILTAKEWISNNAAYITVTCDEDTSGIKSARYKIDDTWYTAESGQFDISFLPNGEYDIIVEVTDNTGNACTHTIPIKKNDVSPTTYVSCDTPNGGAATTQQTINVSDDMGAAWFLIKNEGEAIDGTFNGSTYVELPFFEPGESHVCSFTSKMNITAYSLSGLAGNSVEYVLYIEGGTIAPDYSNNDTAIGSNTTKPLPSTDFKYSLNLDGETLTITQYTGDNKDIVIPSSIGGYAVTEISTGPGFLPDFVESITLPEGLRTIHQNSFAYLPNLTTVNISGTVEEIGDGVFSGCNALTSISVNKSNTTYYDIDGVLFDHATKTLLCYPLNHPSTTYTIPDGTVNIGKYVFYECENIETVTIPVSVECIDYGAFKGFDAFNWLTTIYKGTATQWKNISIAEANDCFDKLEIICTSADQKYLYVLCDYDYEAAFRGDLSNSTMVVVPEEIDGYKIEALGGLDQLIGYEQIESVSISSNIRMIGKNAFKECVNLKTIYFYGTEEQWDNLSANPGNDPFLRAEVVFIPNDEETW